MSKKKKWVCPQCGKGKIGPKYKASDARGHCLPCTVKAMETAKGPVAFVRLVCPAIERERERKAAAAKARAQQRMLEIRERREAEARDEERQKVLEKQQKEMEKKRADRYWTFDGVDLRKEVARALIAHFKIESPGGFRQEGERQIYFCFPRLGELPLEVSVTYDEGHNWGFDEGKGHRSRRGTIERFSPRYDSETVFYYQIHIETEIRGRLRETGKSPRINFLAHFRSKLVASICFADHGRSAQSRKAMCDLSNALYGTKANAELSPSFQPRRGKRVSWYRVVREIEAQITFVDWASRPINDLLTDLRAQVHDATAPVWIWEKDNGLRKHLIDPEKHAIALDYVRDHLNLKYVRVRSHLRRREA